MRLTLAALASLVLFGTMAWAAVYEWVDNQGVVHLTDDLDRVPARYRKALKVRDLDAGGSTAPAAEPEAEAPAPERSVPEAREVLLYDGHDRVWWLTAFKEARGKLKKLQDRIGGKQKTLEELRRKRVLYQKSSDRVAYYALMDEIAQDQEEVKALQNNLADLESRADQAGVPQDWR